MTIADNTGFSVVLTEAIPGNAKKDLPVRFTVASDVVVMGDKVILPKGTVVMGAIVDERKKGALGTGLGGQRMTFKLVQIETPDQKLKVRAEPTKNSAHPVEDSVNGKVKATDAAAAPAGTQYSAYIDGDQTVFVRK